jgi:hypothetical protein
MVRTFARIETRTDKLTSWPSIYPMFEGIANSALRSPQAEKSPFQAVGVM